MDGCGFILTRVWLHVVHYECADGVTITAKRKGTLCTPYQSSPCEHCSNQFSGSGYVEHQRGCWLLTTEDCYQSLKACGLGFIFFTREACGFIVKIAESQSNAEPA